MYTIDNVCALFNITSMTLRRWCHRAHITPHRDPVDRRRRYLGDDQLLCLARLHQRVLIVDTGSAELSAVMMLERRIAEQDRRIIELETKLRHDEG